jgi:hypothetical protein
MTAVTDSPSESLVNGWRLVGVVLGERSAASCQDRASFFPSEGGLVIVVADGVGGVAGGSQAADSVVAAVAAASLAGSAGSRLFAGSVGARPGRLQGHRRLAGNSCCILASSSDSGERSETSGR